jgi:hypothetical protein
MKSIEACMKLYYDVNHQAYGNTNSQSGDIDDCVIPVSDQVPEGCFVQSHRLFLVSDQK